MRIGILGAGAWGFALSCLLARKGCEVLCWSKEQELVDELNQGKPHPKIFEKAPKEGVRFTQHITEALDEIDMLVESVTSQGVHPVFSRIQDRVRQLTCPIVVTSKGILPSGLTLPGVVADLLGEEHKPRIGALSGPSFAKEVAQGLPTSVVVTAYDRATIETISTTFSSESLRAYPNADIVGVSLSGAVKNIIAIACGISDGLGYGNSSKAALVTRGLHEMSKLALEMGGQAETLYGLAGMGDIFLTCCSKMSRNLLFGMLLAEGLSVDAARKKIGMVVEGSYAVEAVSKLAKEHKVPMPITESVYAILQGEVQPQQVATLLMQRKIKDEHL